MSKESSAALRRKTAGNIDHGDARETVEDLEEAGFASTDINIISRQPAGEREADSDDDSDEGAATGATLGGLVGAGAGLLASLGMRG